MRIIKFLAVIFIVIVAAASVDLFYESFVAVKFKGQVVKVIDGDTIDVMRDGKAERVRLGQIDAPERSQPFGRVAKKYVLETVVQEVVVVKVENVDRYGRTVGEVFLLDGRNLNKMIVEAGYAWHYEKYSHDREYGRLEAKARDAGRGLWFDKKPIAPWDWRKGQR